MTPEERERLEWLQGWNVRDLNQMELVEYFALLIKHLEEIINK